MSDDEERFNERVSILENYAQDGLTLEDLGKLILADALLNADLDALDADSDGHVTVHYTGTIDFKLHRPRVGEKPVEGPVCCYCVVCSDGIIICRGRCCR
ncbi:MAG TPA: hypothetical protein VEP49_16980 [Acidimicrobiia bacterium]|nr:hypothetical protein [Acidimicrobiia bacterium]